MEGDFNIEYEGVEMMIRPIRENDVAVAYQIFVSDIYLAEIYPDHGHGPEPPLVWRSHDTMATYMVNAIGTAIESHDD